MSKLIKAFDFATPLLRLIERVNEVRKCSILYFLL